MHSLHRPVYLKNSRPTSISQNRQSPIPTKPAKPPKQPQPMPDEPAPGPSEDESDITTDLDYEDYYPRIPMLICHRKCMLVIPHEATRDVLAGKVAYYLADENGCTKYTPKHMFCALRLNRKQRDKLGEYPVVGGHQRFLPRKEKKKTYKRHYISQDVGARGIYGVSN